MHAGAIRYQDQLASLALVFETTGPQQAERELQFINLIIEQSPVVVFQALAEDGFPREFISNNVSRFGYTAEEAKAGLFRFPDYVHPDDKADVVTKLRNVVANNQDLFEHDYRLITRDGSVRWVHDRTVAVRDETGTVLAYRGTLIDVTERRQAELKLQRANRALRAVSEVNSALVHARCENDFLHEMCQILVRVGGYMLAWIAYPEHDSARSVRVAAAAGSGRDCLEQFGITWDELEHGRGPVGQALRTGRWQVNWDFDTNSDMAPWREACRAPGFGSSAALPLNDGTATFGAIALVSAERDAFDPEEIVLLDELANNAAFGIASLRLRDDHERLHRRLQRSMNDTVVALATTLEMRDPYTAGHQKNVSRLAAKIAHAMGLPESEIEGIALAASLHDIGKLQVPVELLVKPGKLTAPEFRLVQDHVQAGYDILKGIDFPWPVADMVLQHHERLDGSGYPAGKAGEAILLGARIIAVADVFESMTAHRPYRPALGTGMAVAELERGRGVLFDPAAVQACIALSGQPEPCEIEPQAPPARPVLLPSAEATPATEAAEPAAQALTPRQLDVVQRLGRGLSVKEIARDLRLSPGTVKTHLSQAYAALGARNRVEAVLRATAIGAIGEA